MQRILDICTTKIAVVTDFLMELTSTLDQF